MHKRLGFTIVELLIVIVVIGILAGISVVAFTGIQDRARNAQLLSSVDAAEKILRTYYATHGKYPETLDPMTGQSTWGGDAPYACLGKASDYPATSDFGAGECYGSTNHGSTHVYARHYPQLEQQLESIASGLSVNSAASTVIIPGSGKSRGVFYYAYTAYEGGSVGTLMYMQTGDKPCGRGERLFTAPGTPSTGPSGQPTGSITPTPPEGMTQCQVALD